MRRYHRPIRSDRIIDLLPSPYSRVDHAPFEWTVTGDTRPQSPVAHPGPDQSRGPDRPSIAPGSSDPATS